MSANEEQVRISKILSEKGLCSRREADRYIEQGLVLLDGKVVSELGTRALRSQKVELMKKASSIQASKATVILNKPVGYISHLDDEKEFTPASSLITPDNFYINNNVRQNSRFNTTGLAPAGRLDIDSSGLLVLTQDGRIAKQIIGENAIIEKEYLVRIDGTLNDTSMDLLNHGLSLDDYKLKPAKVFWQNEDQLSFTLIEGRHRQIRRMCDLVGVTVVGLKRVRIGNVRLGDIPTKRWRFLNSNESF
ncbi:pseudouridine synthase [Methylophilaceae bacterium]|nr:rRNA pseudouridine synthase [Methylophilaceae bacterium]MDC1173371.1 pseudouridine synthase [Methylophilaceae bacterium]|tara:strand:+ start:1042 stop:1785 length:744 start_codon:yes stop_codon:yes gene_type:complete